MIPFAQALAEATAHLTSHAAARRDAELLLLHCAGIDRTMLLTHPDRTLNDAQASAYRDAIARRARHEPVQYITGVQEFYGRPFRVSPAVLIPRPETEHLIEAVLGIRPQPRRILDIGTGSGVLAVTLALEIPDAAVAATDISCEALGVARWNAQALGAAERIRFVASDLFAAVSEERFDCVVSNPPYVPAHEVLEAQVGDYEPPLALFAGADGLDIYRRLIPQTAAALDPGGHLLLEIGHGQQDAIDALLHAAGFGEVQFIHDLQSIPRVAVARKAV